MYIISGRGRESGVAHATEATASLAPLSISFESMNTNSKAEPKKGVTIYHVIQDG